MNPTLQIASELVSEEIFNLSIVNHGSLTIAHGGDSTILVVVGLKCKKKDCGYVELDRIVLLPETNLFTLDVDQTNIVLKFSGVENLLRGHRNVITGNLVSLNEDKWDLFVQYV